MQLSQNVGSKEWVAEIVSLAGGEIVGRTKLQKLACLLKLAGYSSAFSFEYKHYGPFSAELAKATKSARVFGLIDEEERETDWGGSFSIYRTSGKCRIEDATISEFVNLCVKSESVPLELAATAAFLAATGASEAWKETVSRKPRKVTDGRLEKAKAFYSELRKIETPVELPEI